MRTKAILLSAILGAIFVYITVENYGSYYKEVNSPNYAKVSVVGDSIILITEKTGLFNKTVTATWKVKKIGIAYQTLDNSTTIVFDNSTLVFAHDDGETNVYRKTINVE